jgi:hypothetical protein
MPAQKHIDHQDWRARIDALDQSAEGAIDGSDLWQRLESRLVPAKQRRIGWWFGLAAATIVGLCAGVLFLQNRGDEVSVTKVPVIRVNPKAPPVETLELATVISSNDTAHVSIVSRRPFSKRVSRAIVNREVMPRAAVPSIAKDTQLFVAATVPDTIKAMNAVSVIPKVKSRLKVVHLNELNMPQPPVFNYAGVRPAHVQYRYTGPNNSENLLQIRLSPSN